MKRAQRALSPYESEVAARRKVLDDMRKMSDDELFQIAVRAGIFTKSGHFTKPYIEEASRGTARLADEAPVRPRAKRKPAHRKTKSSRAPARQRA